MSPRSQEQFKEMRESRKQQIMDAALELFAKEGYSHCSISRLATHAGISKGLMYNYFDSKEDLLVAIIEEGMEDIMNMMDPNQDGVFDSEEIEAFIRATFKNIRKNQHFWILFINVVLQPKVKEFLGDKLFGNIMAQFGPRLLDYFKKMGYEDPALEMLTFSAMIEGYGILLVYLSPEDEFPRDTIKKFEDRMVDMFTKKRM